jgi:hypothetical protein
LHERRPPAPGATRCGVSPGGERCRGPPTPAGRHETATRDRLGVLEALVALATTIDASAEGIESPQQLARAHAAGCCYEQGQLLTAPMPVDRVTDWLTEHNDGPAHRSG